MVLNKYIYIYLLMNGYELVIEILKIFNLYLISIALLDYYWHTFFLFREIEYEEKEKLFFICKYLPEGPN